MKIKLLLSLLVVFLTYSTSYASFPVKRTVTTNATTEINSSSTIDVITPIATTAEKDLTVGIILWFFLGWAAGHRWYYGKPVLYNILFIITLGGLGVWWIIDLVNMIQGKF